MTLTTIVTAYYRVPSKHRNDQYDAWIKNMLGTITTPMVIFGDDTTLPMLKTIRGTLPGYFIRLPINEFVMHRHLNYWNRDFQRDIERIVGHNPYLYMIWNEKPFFVERAMQANPFFSDWFIWCDAGYFRGNMDLYSHFPKNDRITSLDPTKFYLLQVQPFTNEERQLDINGMPPSFSNVWRVGGGMLIGSVQSWPMFIDAYMDMLSRFMKIDRFAGKDQNLFASIAICRPDLVTMVVPVNDGGDVWFYLARWLML